MKKTYFGGCEHCGKDYIVKSVRTNSHGEVRCPHCGNWSGNHNGQLRNVREFIQLLKKFPPETKVFFSRESQLSEMYDYCIIDEFDEAIIIRPDGLDFDELEVRHNIREQRKNEQEKGFH